MNPYGDDLIVDQVIGSAYQVVKYVAANMTTLIELSDAMDTIQSVLEQLQDIIANLPQLLEIQENLDELMAIYANLAELLAIEVNLPMLTIIYNVLPELQVIYDNLPAIIDSSHSIAASREAIARSYGEVGLPMDRDESFEEGGTINTDKETLLFEQDGVGYSWGGSLPKVVPAGSTPITTGGFGPTAWIDQSSKLLREQLASHDGVGLVGGKGKYIPVYGQIVEVTAYGGDRVITPDGKIFDIASDGGNPCLNYLSTDNSSKAFDATIGMDLCGPTYITSVSNAIFGSGIQKTPQSSFIDHVNGVLYVAVADTSVSPTGVIFIAFSWSGDTAGAVLFQTETYQFTKGDFLAWERRSDGIYAYASVPTSAPVTYRLKSIKVASGQTTVDHGKLSDNYTQLTNYGADKIAVVTGDEGGVSHLISFADAKANEINLIPIPTSANLARDLMLTGVGQSICNPTGNTWLGISGLDAKQKGVLVTSMTEDVRTVIPFYLTGASGGATAEPEAIFAAYNPTLQKQEVMVMTWDPSISSISLYSMSRGVPARVGGLWDFALFLAPTAYFNGYMHAHEAKTSVAVPALYVGSNRSDQPNAAYGDFELTQLFGGSSGRQAVRQRVFNSSPNGAVDIHYYGASDSLFKPGFSIGHGVAPNIGGWQETNGWIGGNFPIKSATYTGASRSFLSLGNEIGFHNVASPVGLLSETSLDVATQAGGVLQFGQYDGAAVTQWFAMSSAALYPFTDNTRSLGLSSLRYTVVYAATGSINTSDEREKEQVRLLSDAERRVAARLKGMIKAFKFKDAVAAKGDGARIHIGLMAQQVEQAFVEEGLNGFDYALLCFDEWDEQAEVLDDHGQIKTPYMAAGNRYGIRYDELLAFIISAL